MMAVQRNAVSRFTRESPIQCGTGRETRPIGRVSAPRPLTEYREDYPYIAAMYDREEIG